MGKEHQLESVNTKVLKALNPTDVLVDIRCIDEAEVDEGKDPLRVSYGSEFE